MSEPNSELFRDDPAAYYTELGAKAERDRALRIILSEIETTSNLAHKNGSEHTREHAAVMVKLGLLYEMIKD